MKYFAKLNDKDYMTGETWKLIERFTKVCKDRGLRPKTLETEEYVLYRALVDIAKPIETWTTADLDGFFTHLAERGLKPTTVNTCKAGLKGFFTKIGKPEVAAPFKCMARRHMRRLPKNLISRELLADMLKACPNARDRALLYFLYESGCRRGEAQAMTIGSLVFDEYGAVAFLEGKTGQRRVRIIESAPDIKEWLNNHPKRGDKDAPLWTVLGPRGHGGRLGDMGAQGVVKVAAKRAKVGFPVYPHLLRHSRLTELASIMTEFQLRTFAGWTISSDMADVYVKRSGVDTEDVLLEAAGIKRPKAGPDMTKTVCPTCQKHQSPSAAFCYSCGSILPTEAGRGIKAKPTGVTDEDLEKRIQEIMRKMLAKDGEKVKD